jgi:hypothetical protein
MEMEVEEEKWVLIRKEALAVATIMQMHPRFARSKCEHDHLRGVADVRARLRAPLKHEVMCVVRPFILVITSADTTGAMRCCALDSVARFIRQGVICSAHDLEETLAGVLECRFDSSEAGVDELGVLLCVLILLCIADSTSRKPAQMRSVGRSCCYSALRAFVWFRRVEVAAYPSLFMYCFTCFTYCFTYPYLLLYLPLLVRAVSCHASTRVALLYLLVK